MAAAFRPRNLKEALRIRKEIGALPFAGGTDLMVKHKTWTGLPPVFPKDVLFLSHLDELKRIEKRGTTLAIGAGVTYAEGVCHPEMPSLLREAILSIAAPAIRNVATLTGNVCNASPAGDALTALTALDARIELRSLDGGRELSVMEFITGPGRTVLKKDELVTAILIPLRDSNIAVFRKVGTRKANALAKLSFAATGEIRGNRINHLSISFGAVGPTVIRSVELEKTMVGRDLTKRDEWIPPLMDSYAAMIVPIDDQRSTAAYRKQVALNLLEDFLRNLDKRSARHE